MATATKSPAHFLEEAGEYLEANGYVRSKGNSITNATYFLSRQKAVVVHGNQADFMINHDEDPGQRSGGFEKYFSVTGIDQLSLFDWMLLFHITGVVPIRTFLKGLIKEGVCVSQSDLMKSILEHFRVTENIDAVPVNY